MDVARYSNIAICSKSWSGSVWYHGEHIWENFYSIYCSFSTTITGRHLYIKLKLILKMKLPTSNMKSIKHFFFFVLCSPNIECSLFQFPSKPFSHNFLLLLWKYRQSSALAISLWVSTRASVYPSCYLVYDIYLWPTIFTPAGEHLLTMSIRLFFSESLWSRMDLGERYPTLPVP